MNVSLLCALYLIRNWEATGHTYAQRMIDVVCVYVYVFGGRHRPNSNFFALVYLNKLDRH